MALAQGLESVPELIEEASQISLVAPGSLLRKMMELAKNLGVSHELLARELQ
jgi:hypothetical protein